ncbi:MAG: M20/M25/M40 family metallo-hydrolase [Actinomycetota bacterium]
MVVSDALLDPLLEWLRIPSVSAGGANPEALRAAAVWVAERVRSAGGSAHLVEGGGSPLVLGELGPRPAGGSVPTVLIYGHYDVQSPGPLDAWVTPPFEPDIRDGRLYARGACDDKGNFWPLLHTACSMAAEGELPVRVRVLVEGEEEVGSASVVRWLLDEDEGADCAIAFDSGNLMDDERPALTLGARGFVQLRVSVGVATRDLHSGIYGGSVLNAIHVLNRMLAAVLPDGDGILRDELREGIAEIPDVERESWGGLPPAGTVIAEAGGRPLSKRVGQRYYEQNWADASLDVNSIHSGEPRTIVPADAAAHLTMRLAPGQDSDRIGATLERLLRAEAPLGADVDIERSGIDAAAFDSDSPPLRLAREALKRACGTPPLLVRIGGTLPVLTPLAARGIPTILTGFAVGADAFHAPNESFRLEGLRLGEATARELYRGLEEL